MLTLRAAQRAMMSREREARRAHELADALYLELSSQAANILNAYSKEEGRSIISNTITRCSARHIHDEHQILNICYIQLIIDADIFSTNAFSYILDNGLMHPYSKARHLILSFFAIKAMSMGE
jgi:hypothetical protein